MLKFFRYYYDFLACLFGFLFLISPLLSRGKFFLIFFFRVLFPLQCSLYVGYNNLLTNDYSTFICESNNLGDVMFPDGDSTEAEIVCNEGIFSGLYSDSVSTLSLQYLT